MYVVGAIPSESLFGIGIVMLVAILLRRLTRENRRGNRLAGSVTDDNYTPSVVDTPPEISRWQVEMHELARDLTAQLDSKISVLRTLIGMAQQEAQKLDKAVGNARKLGLSIRNDELEQIERISSQLPYNGLDLCMPSRAERQHGSLPGSGEQRRTVYHLTDLGQSPESIADQVGSSVADVELMLAGRGKV